MAPTLTAWQVAIFAALFLGGCQARKNVSFNWDDDALIGPRRSLLATRTVSGKVTWSYTSQPISGAVVRAYDQDPIGRDSMGSTRAGADGSYKITYTVKKWDFCCGSSTNPDIVLEVFVGGRLYYRGPEYPNVASNLVVNIRVTSYIVSGTLRWYETCAAAARTTAIVYDEDVGADEVMGRGVTDTTGYYSIRAPHTKGGSSWDLGGGRPDMYVQFSTAAWGIAGKTATKNNVPNSGGDYFVIYMTTRLWRGDKGAAAAIYNTIRGDEEEYVTVTEYAHCSPKKMVVTVRLNFKKALLSAPSNTVFSRMKQLTKDGIKENWSRTGTRAITVNRVKWDVIVNVVESSSGYSTSMKHQTKVEASCERSHNVGAPALGLDMTLWYNEGCAKYGNQVGWQAVADDILKDTAAHEWGHTVLQQAISTTESWTHKGSTTLLQAPSASATNYPASGDIDIMLYYKNGSPPTSRTFATEVDVKRLISLGKPKRVVYCGTCPV